MSTTEHCSRCLRARPRQETGWRGGFGTGTEPLCPSCCAAVGVPSPTRTAREELRALLDRCGVDRCLDAERAKIPFDALARALAERWKDGPQEPFAVEALAYEISQVLHTLTAIAASAERARHQAGVRQASRETERPAVEPGQPGKTVVLHLSRREVTALEELAAAADLSLEAALRHALCVYQLWRAYQTKDLDTCPLCQPHSGPGCGGD